MADRAKRRRVAVQTISNGSSSGNPIYRPATVEEKSSWKGWCEIESEPAFFTVMLKEFGVKDAKVQEVFTMDEEILAGLSKPVHGLIFLFRWQEDDPKKQEPSCPEEVWFANQTNSNACATIALLNIVNNVPSLELGENLKSFKEFTKDFTPALRGYSIGNFEFARQIHNSFARKMDMYNIDMTLRNEATAKHKRGGGKAVDNIEEAGFHFIALVPIGEHVWKLDGLERQPQKLGKIGKKDWLKLATPIIHEKMDQYASDEGQFVLLAVGQDPLSGLRQSLAENIKAITRINERLDEEHSGWRVTTTNGDQSNGTAGMEDTTIQGPDVTYGVIQEMIEKATVPESVEKKLGSKDVNDLVCLRMDLIRDQAVIRAEIKGEELSQADEAKRAASRRHDHGPSVQAWLKKLSRSGDLRRAMTEMNTRRISG